MKIAFLIRSLEVGGAERQLAYLAGGLQDAGVKVSVGVFYGGGELEQLLLSNGIRVEYLKKKGRWDIVGFFLRTIKWLRRENPDYLHGYLIGANLVSALVKPFVYHIRIVWGVRASNMKLENYDWLARSTFRISVWLSRVPVVIIANSESGSKYHICNGYPSDRMVVIPNGIDTTLFKPDLPARQIQRTAWRVDKDVCLIGIVGRLDPMKDHKTFLKAACKVLSKRNDIKFICVGHGNKKYLEGLQDFSEEFGISNYILWEPGQGSIENVYNALDVLVSTSAFGEGFSNTLAEAMACGVRCIATDVGDAKKILMDTGVVVPAENSSAVAEGILKILDGDKGEHMKIKKMAVDHIRENYSIDRLVSNTLNVLTMK